MRFWYHSKCAPSFEILNLLDISKGMSLKTAFPSIIIEAFPSLFYMAFIASIVFLSFNRLLLRANCFEIWIMSLNWMLFLFFNNLRTSFSEQLAASFIFSFIFMFVITDFVDIPLKC